METAVLDNAFIGKNVRTARKLQELDLKDVATRLSEMGHPIGVSALSKLETNGRKILAEDLPFLAAALGVTPNVLMLGDGTGDESPSMNATVKVAGTWEIELVDAWRWVQGEKLPRSQSGGGVIKMSDLRAQRAWRARSRPHDPPVELSLDEHQELQEAGVFDGLCATVADLQGRGFSVDVARQHLEAIRTSQNLKQIVRDAVEASPPEGMSPEEWGEYLDFAREQAPDATDAMIRDAYERESEREQMLSKLSPGEQMDLNAFEVHGNVPSARSGKVSGQVKQSRSKSDESSEA